MDTSIEPKTKGEKFEGVAFQFCKVATVALLAGRFVLPVASGLCAVFYALAWFNGKRDTRCVLKYAPVLVVFWGAICAVSVMLMVKR